MVEGFSFFLTILCVVWLIVLQVLFDEVSITAKETSF